MEKKPPKKIKAYLRGMILAHGRIKIKSVNGAEQTKARVFHVKALPAFRNAVVLFPKLGLFPRFKIKRKNVQIIFSGPELEKLEQSGLLSMKHLQELGRMRKDEEQEEEETEKRRHLDLDTVERVLQLKKQGTPAETIENVTGVPKDAHRFWEKKPPFSAQRLAYHFQHAERIGYPTRHLKRWPLALKLVA